MSAKLLISVCLSLLSSCATVLPRGLLRFESQSPVEVKVEIAATVSSRTRGLMFRTELNELAGMLFVFDETKPHVFWMKNTFCSLDLIFFDDKLTVLGVIANTEPESLKRLDIGTSSRYVLEVPAGTAERFHITKNTQAQLICQVHYDSGS